MSIWVRTKTSLLIRWSPLVRRALDTVCREKAGWSVSENVRLRGRGTHSVPARFAISIHGHGNAIGLVPQGGEFAVVADWYDLRLKEDAVTEEIGNAYVREVLRYEAERLGATVELLADTPQETVYALNGGGL